MNFSRRKLAAPAPPWPLWTQIFAESRNRMTGARSPGRPAGDDYGLLGGCGAAGVGTTETNTRPSRSLNATWPSIIA